MSEKWAARVRRRSSLLGVAIPPWTEALDLLDAHEGADDSRAAKFYRTHAHGALAQVHSFTHRDPPNRRLSKILSKQLETLLLPAGVSVAQVEADSTPGAALGRAHGEPKLEIIGPCDLDDAGITRFYAKITRARKKGETFLKLARNTNPQNWQNILPQQFSRTYEAAFDTICNKPRVDDPAVHLPKSRLQHPWEGFLFERFEPTFCGTAISTFRNILGMRFTAEKDKGTDTGKIGFEYRLEESLTNSVLEGPATGGGIDVDSNDPGSCKVTVSPAEVQINAGKNIRFSSETGVFQEELNLTALPLLAIWILALLLEPAVTN
jgi:hypothetical protein